MNYFTVWARSVDLRWAEAARVEFGTGGCVFRYLESWLTASWAYSLDPIHLPLSPTNFYAADHRQLIPLLQQILPQGWYAHIFTQKSKIAVNCSPEKQLKNIPNALNNIRLTHGNEPLSEPILPPWDDLETFFTMVSQQNLQDWPLARYFALMAGGCWQGSRAKITLQGKPNYWLAKWQMPNDILNWPQIEFATMQLLHEAGFNVPARHLIPMQSEKWAYLIERFDLSKTDPGYFVPANILLTQSEQSNGQIDARQDTTSYIALARCLRKYSSQAKTDVVDLFRRMLANLLLNNTHDTPHKFGMFYSVKTHQWRLSPVFGVCPTVDLDAHFSSKNRQGSGMGMGKSGRTRSIANALSLCTEFGLNIKQAESHLEELRLALATWKDVFEHCGVSGYDRQQLAPFIKLSDF